MRLCRYALIYARNYTCMYVCMYVCMYDSHLHCSGSEGHVDQHPVCDDGDLPIHKWMLQKLPV